LTKIVRKMDALQNKCDKEEILFEINKKCKAKNPPNIKFPVHLPNINVDKKQEEQMIAAADQRKEESADDKHKETIAKIEDKIGSVVKKRELTEAEFVENLKQLKEQLESDFRDFENMPPLIINESGTVDNFEQIIKRYWPFVGIEFDQSKKQLTIIFNYLNKTCAGDVVMKQVTSKQNGRKVWKCISSNPILDSDVYKQINLLIRLGITSEHTAFIRQCLQRQLKIEDDEDSVK